MACPVDDNTFIGWKHEYHKEKHRSSVTHQKGDWYRSKLEKTKYMFMSRYQNE